MARRVRDDEFAARRGEVAVGDVDGDALFALGAEAVGEEREVDLAGGGGAFALDGLDLVFVDGLRVVEQAADEGGFAVVDGAGGGEAEEVFLALFGEEFGDGEVFGDDHLLVFSVECWLRFVVSHPSDKHKDVARVGHPA